MSASSEMQDPNVPTKDSVACSPAPLCNTAAEKHSPQKKGPKRHKCTECFKEFKRKYDLKDHMYAHMLAVREQRRRELRFKCIVCVKMFKRNGDLKDHMSVHTGVPIARKQRKRKCHKCIVCEKLLWSPYAMKEHMNVHTGVRNYECQICGKKFFHRRSLQNHNLTHSPDKPHKCQLCTSAFTRSCYLANHMFCVHGIKWKIKCSDGNRYYFPYDASEVSHANKCHEGEIKGNDEQPVKCERCDAQFIHRWSLRVHVDTVHIDKRPFLCTVCGKTYKSKGSLRIHSVIHMEARKVRAECKICHRVLKATSMYQHMKSHEEKKFLCNFCGKRFSLKHQLINHEKSHLGLKEHACDLCEKRFTLPHQMRAHRETHSEYRKQK